MADPWRDVHEYMRRPPTLHRRNSTPHPPLTRDSSPPPPFSRDSSPPPALVEPSNHPSPSTAETRIFRPTSIMEAQLKASKEETEKVIARFHRACIRKATPKYRAVHMDWMRAGMAALRGMAQFKVEKERLKEEKENVTPADSEDEFDCSDMPELVAGKVTPAASEAESEGGEEEAAKLTPAASEAETEILEDKTIRLEEESVRLEEESVKLEEESLRLQEESAKLKEETERLVEELSETDSKAETFILEEEADMVEEQLNEAKAKEAVTGGGAAGQGKKKSQKKRKGKGKKGGRKRK